MTYLTMTNAIKQGKGLSETTCNSWDHTSIVSYHTDTANKKAYPLSYSTLTLPQLA